MESTYKQVVLFKGMYFKRLFLYIPRAFLVESTPDEHCRVDVLSVSITNPAGAIASTDTAL